MDPADRVASSKANADDIKTWAVSEIDAKGKKKKGTLGIGNGAVFFASESDKVCSNLLFTPVGLSPVEPLHVIDASPEMANPRYRKY